MLRTKAYAIQSLGAAARPFEINRREPGPHDVLMDILYCGICHTDVHLVRGEFPNPIFPIVPGHEIVGRVAQVGSAVTRFAVGDAVGVGCLVDSCRQCPECEAGEEQFCVEPMISTSNAYGKDGQVTYGGFSSRMTVDENYVLRVPAKLDPARAAPLLCAGITTYSPLRHWGVGPGSKVGIVGLGGLGHLAVKLAVAMGADVTVLSSSEGKRADAARLGATRFAMTTKPEAMSALSGSLDLILNTVSSSINYDAFIDLLRRDGTLVLLGIPDAPVTLNSFGLLTKRRSVASSMIAGIRETQQMLDFCAVNGINADIEVIPISSVNEAFERILKGDVRYRFVVDIATLK